MRNPAGNILRYRGLVLILCKADPPNKYKIESATESVKWCFNGWFENMIF
jgi:hypothetical protein